MEQHGSKSAASGTSKCKRFIKLSPSSKKKSSRNKDGGTSYVTSDIMETAQGQTRVPNGYSEKGKSPDAEWKEAFELFDKNKDGKISSDELGCVLRTLGHKHSATEVEEMIKNADTNENGYVEYEEFITMMNRAATAPGCTDEDDDRRREAFKIFDVDGNGFIDKHELKFVMRRLGEELSEDDLKAMFNEADLNGDGLIDYDEFCRLNMV